MSLAPSGLISNRLDAQIKCANVTINSQCVNNMYALHKASDYEEINMTPKGYITTPKAVGPFLCHLNFEGHFTQGCGPQAKQERISKISLTTLTHENLDLIFLILGDKTV